MLVFAQYTPPYHCESSFDSYHSKWQNLSFDEINDLITDTPNCNGKLSFKNPLVKIKRGTGILKYPELLLN